MLTGRVITPDEALRLGAVSRVVSRDQLDEAVDQVVDALLALSPTTLMMGKDSFNAMADMSLDAAFDRLQGGLTEIAMTADAREGVDAFVQKRSPRWTHDRSEGPGS